MQASIQATAQRFEMERKVLELKQAMQVLEQQSAIRAADRAVQQERQQLLELRSELADPQTSSQQKPFLNEQIRLQGEMIRAALSLAGIERERMTGLGMILGLERQTQQAQQGAAANQQRAAAASKGWEESLGGALAAVDKAATGVDRLKQVFVGTIQAQILDLLRRLAAERGTAVLLITHDMGVVADMADDVAVMYGGRVVESGPVEQIFAAASGLPEPLRNATDATKQLGDGFAEANAQALVLLQTVSKLAAAPSARWAGGGVDPSGRYQVNELGTESFLSRSGALSLIQAPAYGSWSPPSAGMVLPAGLTARLDAMGAFSGGAPAPVLAGIAPAMGGGSGSQQAAALGRLQRSIDALESTMRSYSPAVTVNLPNNAGLLNTLQGIR